MPLTFVNFLSLPRLITTANRGLGLRGRVGGLQIIYNRVNIRKEIAVG